MLAEEAATVFLNEFRDESKATAAYLSSIGGTKSCAEITEEVRVAGMNKSASNSISESAHAGLTRGMEQCGMVRIDHAAAEGQTIKNRDTHRCHEKYTSKKKQSRS